MLDDPAKKEIAMQIALTNENSSLDWRDQYKYIEDIDDGRGYTGGIGLLFRYRRHAAPRRILHIDDRQHPCPVYPCSWEAVNGT